MAKIDIQGGLSYLENALNYVNDDHAINCSGYGVNPYDPAMAYDQMLATKRYFGKTSGNPLVHIVIAYNRSVKDAATAASYGQQIASYFASKFQLLYCTHAKDFTCGYYHTHLIINSVSFINGKMIQTGYDEMKAFCDYVQRVTGQKCSFYFDNKSK